MKPVLQLLLVTGLFLSTKISQSQVTTHSDNSHFFSPSDVQEIFSHSSSSQSGIALIQPGTGNSDKFPPAITSTILTSFNPAIVLEFEAIQSPDSNYRSSQIKISSRQRPNTPFAYELIPRTEASLLEKKSPEENQESLNYVSDLTINDVHVFNIGIGKENFELSQSTLDYVRNARRQQAHFQKVLLFLSFPPEMTGELKGMKDLEKLLGDRSFSVYLPYSSLQLPSYKYASNYHFLSQAQEQDQLYWISLSEKKPVLSQINLIDQELIQSDCFNLLKDFGTQLPIQTASLWNPEDSRPKGYLEITVENPTAYPMRLDANFLSHDQIFPSLGAIESVIYPGSDKTLRIKLRTTSTLPASAPPLLQWSWKLTCMLSQSSETSLSGTMPITLSSQSFPALSSNIWTFQKNVIIELQKPIDNVNIHYSLNEEEPSLRSPIAPDSLVIEESCTLKTKIFHPNGSYSQTESCTFIKAFNEKGLWKDLYPVNASFGLGEVSSLLASKVPLERRFVSSLKEIPLAPTTPMNHFVQVLRGSIILSDSINTLSMNFNRLPRILVRVDGEELQAYEGIPLPYTLGPGKHEWEIISLEQREPRPIQPKLTANGILLPIHRFRAE